jgi:hypothetical protein
MEVRIMADESVANGGDAAGLPKPSGGDSQLVSDAVQAFHTIYRLSVMCTQEIGRRNTDDDGDVLLLAIRDIADKHGRALDGHPDSDGLGVFEHEDDAQEGAANG